MSEAGKHDFTGACAPSHAFASRSWITFSVGVFQWLPKASGKGLKRGPVKVRVAGLVSDPEAVNAKAREIAAQLDAGTYSGPRRVDVRRAVA